MFTQMKMMTRVSVAAIAALAVLAMRTEARAASVDWEVGSVAGVVVATGDLKLIEVEAELTCHFEDGSGVISSTPYLYLASKMTPASGAQGGQAYKVQIAGGQLEARKWLADLRSCSYNLHLLGTSKGERVTGRITLAGSIFNQDKRAMKELLEDPNLNKKISKRLHGMRLTVGGISSILEVK